MKYRCINPEVTANQVTGSNVLVTFSSGLSITITQEEFDQNFRVKLSGLSEQSKEMYQLCTKIVEIETFLDDDGNNAEALLAEAAETAKQLRRLIK